jgi:hypothetical protein
MVGRLGHLYYMHLAEAQAQRHRLGRTGSQTRTWEIWIYVRLLAVVAVCGSVAALASWLAA